MRHKPEQEGKPRPTGDLRMHDEDRIDRHHQTDQQAVDERLVIGHNQRARVVERRCVAEQLDTEEEFQYDGEGRIFSMGLFPGG